jgi:hypothetical protein
MPSQQKASCPLVPPPREFIKLSNWLIDVAMPELSGNAFKLLNFIYRQTLFSKDPNERENGKEFSNLQLMRGAGIGSFSTIQEAISELDGSLKKEKRNKKGRVYIITTHGEQWDKVHYRINLNMASIATETVASDNENSGPLETEDHSFLHREPLSDATEIVASPATEAEHYENCSATENGAGRYEKRSDDATEIKPQKGSIATETVDIIKKEEKEKRKKEKKPSADATQRRREKPVSKMTPDQQKQHRYLMDILDSRTGKIPDGAAQAGAVEWLLLAGYSPPDCIECLDWLLKTSSPEYRVSWLNVKKMIGNYLLRKQNGTSGIGAKNGYGNSIKDFEERLRARSGISPGESDPAVPADEDAALVFH